MFGERERERERERVVNVERGWILNAGRKWRRGGPEAKRPKEGK
jgi:hypothetical protein